MLEKLRLDGRVAVVIGGGGGGLGSATSQALAEAGAAVAVVELTPQRARDVVDRIEEAGGRALALQADVRDAYEVEAAFEHTLAECGRLDCLVNVVGGSRLESRNTAAGTNTSTSTVVDFLDEVYDELLAVNLHYVFRSCRSAARHMIAQGRGGSIVNFGSASGLAASPFNVAYGLSKAAVTSLTQTLAVELGTYGIRANCVAPGSVPAPLAQAAAPSTVQAMDAKARAKSPLGRRVQPEEVAGAVVFLASDLSSGITGQCLNVDVGASANHPLGTYLEYAELARLRRMAQE